VQWERRRLLRSSNSIPKASSRRRTMREICGCDNPTCWAATEILAKPTQRPKTFSSQARSKGLLFIIRIITCFLCLLQIFSLTLYKGQGFRGDRQQGVLVMKSLKNLGIYFLGSALLWSQGTFADGFICEAPGENLKVQV